MTVRRLLVAAVFTLVAVAAPALAQGPLHQKIHFTINQPFELKKGSVVLPAGHYVLFQFNPNDRQLFALYRDDLTHSPIAMIRTTRIDYVGRWPSKTKMLLDIDEGSPRNYVVIEGWNVPGELGWEVISVVADRDYVIANSRYQSRSVARARRGY